MQKQQQDGVVIACDFCGDDWDEVKAMIEGHHGSVLCLECLKVAMAGMVPAAEPFNCTLCLREDLPAATPRWSPQPRPRDANPNAVVCEECLSQAARAFHRDKDVDWLMAKS